MNHVSGAKGGVAGTYNKATYEREIKAALALFGVEVFPTDGIGVLQLKLFEATTESKLVQPTFIVAHPTDVSPLARLLGPDVTPVVLARDEPRP